MTAMQDRLKRAIDATAGQISEGSIPPFRAPEPARRRARPRLHRPPRWLPPLAAAISMAIIAATVVVVSNLRHQSLNGADAVPPYYAAINITSPPTSRSAADALTIRSTATGQVLATVPKPAPHFVFSQVTAAADDRTFVAAAESVLDRGVTPPWRFYLLHFRPATGKVSVTELPIRDVTGSATIALSPNGRYLAVIEPDRIHVYSVPSGAERSWLPPSSPPGLALIGPPAWVGGNRYLTYFIYTGPSEPSAPFGTYLLDTTSLRKNWLSAGHQPTATLRHECSPSYFLPRQSMIVCTIVTGPDNGAKAYVADISLRTGKILRRLPLPAMVRYANDPAPILAWAGRNGTTAVVLMAVATGPTSVFGVTPTVTRAFAVTSHGFTKLPGEGWHETLSAVPPAAW